MTRARRNILAGLLWCSPFLAGSLLFLAVPAAMSLAASFTDSSLIEPPNPVGLDNYREMLRDTLLRRVAINTLAFTLGSILIGAPLSVAIAALLEIPSPLRRLARSVVFFPTLVPVVAASIGWMWLYAPESGLLNRFLRALALPGVDWLGDARTAMPALVLMSLWCIGTPVVVYAAAMRAVPASLYDAAHIDGMSAPRRFLHVTLPMISPAILFNVVVSIVWSLQVFAAPAIMTRGGPGDATNVYALYVYRNAFDYGRLGYASALAWVQLLVTLALSLAVVALSRRLVYYRGA